MIFSLRSCTACARACSRCACLPARAGGRPRRLGCSRSTRRQRRKVDKCRVADKKQTNQQTNTHCSFIGIDYCLLCSGLPIPTAAEAALVPYASCMICACAAGILSLFPQPFLLRSRALFSSVISHLVLVLAFFIMVK